MQTLVGEPLVVTEIEIGLTAIVGHEHLAMLKGVHRAGIDVDVWVEFLVDDPQSASLHESTEGGCGDAFSEAGGDTARYEHVFRHGMAQ